jgi:5-methylcytosine-specific restriction protein A
MDRSKSLQIAKTGLSPFNHRRVAALPKVAAPVYHTPEYRVWRETVIARAGRRCESVTDGRRCWRAEPTYRMFADHRIEIKDGGALHDVSNGQCLCGSHHTAKTAAARAARR